MSPSLMPGHASELARQLWSAQVGNASDTYLEIAFPSIHQAADWARTTGYTAGARFVDGDTLTLSTGSPVIVLVPNANSGDIRDARDWILVNSREPINTEQLPIPEVIEFVAGQYPGGWIKFISDRNSWLDC